MPELHATFGGSTAARTMNCPAWVQLSSTLPKGDSSSSFADAGTLCHMAMEAIFGDDVAPEECLGMVYKDQLLTEDVLHEKILPAVAAVKELFAQYGITEWAVEERVGFTEDSWGTGDLLAKGPVWSMVADYKFGYNKVSPVENDQFLFYGSAAYHTAETADLFDDNDNVVFAVVQPSDDGDYETWETTTKRLRDFRKPWLVAVEAAKAPDPEACAGEWCKYCPAASICPQKSGSAQRALLMKPDDLLTLSANLKLADEMESWISDVRDTAHTQLEQGAPVKGWKLVAKRANRSWIDAEKAIAKLGRKLGGRKNVVKTVPISPAQAEALAKKMKVELDLSAMTNSISSGTTMAKAADKRPEVLNLTQAAAALGTLVN